MANNLYNGVSLPALPDYDTSAFPYAYISKNTAGTAYILTVAEERPVYGVSPEDSTVTGVYHYGLSRAYLVDGEAWVLQVEADSFVCTADGVGSVIWTNTDILESDGSVYLTAGEPVGTADWLKSFKMGLAMGLCGKPLPYAQKEPVAYLYNGVRLPKLPEWDETAYPYAQLRHFHSGNASIYWLDCYSKRPEFCIGENSGAELLKYESQEKTQYRLDDSTGEWYLNWTGTASGGSIILESNTIIWANFDIMNADNGSVFFQKSPEPVPVEESTDASSSVLGVGELGTMILGE